MSTIQVPNPTDPELAQRLVLDLLDPDPELKGHARVNSSLGLVGASAPAPLDEPQVPLFIRSSACIGRREKGV
jgi:hypothetical protein